MQIDPNDREMRKMLDAHAEARRQVEEARRNLAERLVQWRIEGNPEHRALEEQRRDLAHRLHRTKLLAARKKYSLRTRHEHIRRIEGELAEVEQQVDALAEQLDGVKTRQHQAREALVAKAMAELD